MKIKRIFALLLLLALLLSATACGQPPVEEEPEENMPVPVTLWLYPLEGSAEKAVVKELLQGFAETHPDVAVEVTYLNEETADLDVSAAIECGECPDLLLGSLSQLQHAQRRGALAVDLGELCKSGVYPAVKEACTNSGLFYALPVVMDVTCMAINYELFRDADALQYINEEDHTWTTENFFKAIQAVKKFDLMPDVLAVYCGGQNGDEGTRALVTNLYGGSFTDPSHSRYVLDSEENINALTVLQKQSGVIFDETIVGPDENILFAQEQLAISLYWGAEREQPESFTAFPMAYPTAEGTAARMPGQVWGFSCFDNDDEDTLTAAKELLSYLTGKDAVYDKLVTLCGHYGVRHYSGAVEDDFSEFMPLMGPYELYTPGFAIARGEWYEMLQRLGSGTDIDIAAELDTFCTNANAAARDMK